MRAHATIVTALAIAVGLLGLPRPAASQATDWKAIQKPPLKPFQPRAAGPDRPLQRPGDFPAGGPRAAAGPRHRAHPRRIPGGARRARPASSASTGRPGAPAARSRRPATSSTTTSSSAAARVETGGGLDSTTISWDCLEGNFDEVFAVFHELLRQPEFREDKIVLAKNQLNTGIARRNDEPLEIAGREARKLGYGADSPYARVPEYASVAAVTRDDLLPVAQDLRPPEQHRPGHRRRLRREGHGGDAPEGPRARGRAAPRRRRRRSRSRTRSPASTSSRKTT